MEKICSKCKKSKDTEEFANDKSKKDGKNPKCRKCFAEWRKLPEVKARTREYERRYYYGHIETVSAKNRRESSKRARRNFHLKSHYGITLEDKQALLSHRIISVQSAEPLTLGITLGMLTTTTLLVLFVRFSATTAIGASVIYRMSQPFYLAHTDTFLGIRDKMAKKQQTQPASALTPEQRTILRRKCQTDLFSLPRRARL